MTMLFHSRQLSPSEPRRGVILLIVLTMLALFAIIGISFALYASAEAESSRIAREAETKTQPDIDPELALSLFLQQFLYDVKYDDSDHGLSSGLRGTSLARLMYSYNEQGGPNPNPDTIPWSGVGRQQSQPGAQVTFLDAKGNPLPPQQLSQLINYTYFEGRNGLPLDKVQDPRSKAILYFVQDPEYGGYRALSINQPVNLADLSKRGGYSGGYNAPYTAADANNLFLAEVRSDGTVVQPSFFRTSQNVSNFSLDPASPNYPNWTISAQQAPWLKYMTLRPRPVDQLLQGESWPPNRPYFPLPEEGPTKDPTTGQLLSPGGDVKNRLGSPGGNDSIWIDIGAPVMVAANGIKYKMMVAPLIEAIDNRVNILAHGNIRGIDPVTGFPVHRSNHGIGPWEVNLSKVLTGVIPGTNPGQPEWVNLFRGTNAIASITGRYGADGFPQNPGSVAVSGRTAHFYGPLDIDAANEYANFGLTTPFALPIKGLTPNSTFPTYAPKGGFGSGSLLERQHHPLLYDVLAPGGDDRTFPPSNMEALLRYDETGQGGMNSELLRILRNNLVTGPNAGKLRRLITTMSFDLDRPGINSTWKTQPLPLLKYALTRLDLNRPLTPYPLFPSYAASTSGNSISYDRNQTTATYTARFDDPKTPASDVFKRAAVPAQAQFLQAQKDRQDLARDIYRRFLIVASLPAVANPASPTAADLAPRRALAQLAVNIVDFIDEDDISTPFNFYNNGDLPAGTPAGTTVNIAATDPTDPELPLYWVFGTELPHVVINEVLAEALVNVDPKNSSVVLPTGHKERVWIELYNPFQVPATPPFQPTSQTPFQAQDGFPVSLAAVPAVGSKNDTYTPYQIVITQGTAFPPAQMVNNVLGKPVVGPNTVLHYQSSVADFQAEVDRIDNKKQGPAAIPGEPALPSPYIDVAGRASDSTPFFLLGPPSRTVPDPNLPDPFVAPGATGNAVPPANTPVLRRPGLNFTNVTSQTLSAEATNGLTVILRRLANPHLPPQPLVGQANYNPYLTIDFIDRVPLRGNLAVLGGPITAEDQTLVHSFISRGKLQPYAAFSKTTDLTGNTLSIYQAGVVTPSARDSLVVDCDQKQASTPPKGGIVHHTFGRPNVPAPATGYDWLVHLDRQLISPIELLQVSAFRPYELTQQFMQSSEPNQTAKRFQQYATWLQDFYTVPYPSWLRDSFANSPGPVSLPLYRALELFTVGTAYARGTALGGRIPGKINLNLVTDVETFRALLDAQYPNYFCPSFPLTAPVTQTGTPTPVTLPSQYFDDPLKGTATNPFLGQLWQVGSASVPQGSTVTLLADPGPNQEIVQGIVAPINQGGVTKPTLVASFQKQHVFQPSQTPPILIVLQVRLPDGSVIQPEDPYFQWWSTLLTNLRSTSSTNPGTTFGFEGFAGGVTIKDTMLCPVKPPQTQTALDATIGTQHPYTRYEVWNKVFNSVTARSNVFAVWLTVGFFEVKDDTTRPPLLGAEIGRAAHQNIRHRMFAIVDRSQMQAFNTTLAQPIVLPVGMASAQNVPFQLAATSNPADDPTTGRRRWAIQDGTVLTLDTGLNEETVVVSVNQVNGQPVYTATFTKNHAAGVTVFARGNPGPWKNFDPRNNRAVVPHFSIID
jgi:hypothetical protein